MAETIPSSPQPSHAMHHQPPPVGPNTVVQVRPDCPCDHVDGKPHDNVQDLKAKAERLRREIAELREHQGADQRQMGVLENDARMLESQSVQAEGQALEAQGQAAHHEAEATAAEQQSATDSQKGDTAESTAESYQREAELLRTQGEQMLMHCNDDGDSQSHQDAMDYLEMAGQRDRMSQGFFSDAQRHRANSGGLRQFAQSHRNSERDAKNTAAGAEQRARQTGDGAREKRQESGDLRLEALGLARQLADKELELKLLEAHMDELGSMAADLDYIVADPKR